MREKEAAKRKAEDEREAERKKKGIATGETRRVAWVQRASTPWQERT